MPIVYTLSQAREQKRSSAAAAAVLVDYDTCHVICFEKYLNCSTPELRVFFGEVEFVANYLCTPTVRTLSSRMRSDHVAVIQYDACLSLVTQES